MPRVWICSDIVLFLSATLQWVCSHSYLRFLAMGSVGIHISVNRNQLLLPPLQIFSSHLDVSAFKHGYLETHGVGGWFGVSQSGIAL